MPASTTRLAPAGLAATLLPISKNVALAVVERQRDALDLCAVHDVVGVREPDVPGERADPDDGGRCRRAGDGAPVPPGLVVRSFRHGRSLPAAKARPITAVRR
jgi:hypothetical protein